MPLPSLHRLCRYVASRVQQGNCLWRDGTARRRRGAGPTGRLHIAQPQIWYAENPTIDMGAAGRPRPGSARQTLTEWQGRVQLQMALAYHRVVLRPTYQKTLNAHWPRRAKSPVTPIWTVGRIHSLDLLALLAANSV